MKTRTFVDQKHLEKMVHKTFWCFGGFQLIFHATNMHSFLKRPKTRAKNYIVFGGVTSQWVHIRSSVSHVFLVCRKLRRRQRKRLMKHGMGINPSLSIPPSCSSVYQSWPTLNLCINTLWRGLSTSTYRWSYLTLLLLSKAFYSGLRNNEFSRLLIQPSTNWFVWPFLWAIY